MALVLALSLAVASPALAQADEPAAAQPVHLFVDEGWHLLQYAGTAAELGAMARRFRKHYAAIHLATQFGQDLCTLKGSEAAPGPQPRRPGAGGARDPGRGGDRDVVRAAYATARGWLAKSSQLPQ